MRLTFLLLLARDTRSVIRDLNSEVESKGRSDQNGFDGNTRDSGLHQPRGDHSSPVQDENRVSRRSDGPIETGYDISVGKMMKRGIKSFRRFVRQSLSDIPENKKGTISDVIEDILN